MDGGRTELFDHLADTVPEINKDDMCRVPTAVQRIGRFSTEHSKPKPTRLFFASENDKHKLLEYSKQFRQAGLRFNYDLTRLHQQERMNLSDDFQALTSKGHKPFFRGSVLKYRCNID